MANKNIRLNMSLDTNQATKSIGSLGNETEKLQSKLNNLKAGKISPSATDIEQSSDDRLSSVLESLDSTLKNMNKGGSTGKGGGGGGGGESPTPTDSGLTLGKALGAILGSKAILGYAKEGRDAAQKTNISSMDTYNRVGIYGNDFNRGRTEAYNLGKNLGYTADETMGLQGSILDEIGFKGKKSLDKDTQSLQSFSRAYGTDELEPLAGFGQLTKAGTYKVGESSSYLNLIAQSIKNNGMEGRESEQIRAIKELQSILTDGKLEVSSEDFKELLSFQEQLTKANPNLKGDKGVELLKRAETLTNPNDEMMLRIFGYGPDRMGAKGLEDTQRLMEQGLGSFETREALRKGINRLGGGQNQHVRQFLHDKMGVNWENLDAFVSALYNDNKDDVLRLSGDGGKKDIEEKVRNAETSKENEIRVSENSKEQAKSDFGNFQNEARGPFAKLYSELPSPVRAGLSMTSAFALPVIGTNLATKGLSKALPFLGKSLTEEGTKAALPKLGLSKLGKAAPYLYGAYEGVRAVGDFAGGDTRSGLGHIGKGVGFLAGAKAGALLGAKVGTVTSPGIGTAVGIVGGAVIGGVGGYLGGEALKGGYDLFNKGKNKDTDKDLSNNKVLPQKKTRKTKEQPQTYIPDENSDLIKWKERILKKEEDLLDAFTEQVDRLGNNDQKPVTKKENKSEFQQATDKFLETGSESDKNYATDKFFESIGSNTETTPPELATPSTLKEPMVPATPSTLKEPPTLTGEDVLGKISAKYEVGGLNGGVISHTKGDYGGVSYGIPQFSTTTGSAKSFVNSLKGTKYEKFFAGLSPGTKDFDKAWTAAYNSDKKGFTKAQQDYTYNNFVSPYIARIKKKTGIDLGRSRALQELAYSTAVQYGPGTSLIGGNSKLSSSMSDEDIIKTVYKDKRDTVGRYFKSSSGKVRNSVRNRFTNEEQDLLALVGSSSVNEDLAKEAYSSQATGGTTTNGNVDFNVNINSNDATNPEVLQAFKTALQQAMGQVANRDGVNLSRSYVRTQI